MPISGVRDLQTKRRSFREAAIITMLTSILITSEVRTIHQAHVCSTARKYYLNDFTTLAVAEVMLYEFHGSALFPILRELN
jgi:hypothetical protein